MRALPRSSTIASVLVHPDIHRELARQRHQDLLADADRRRLATTGARFVLYPTTGREAIQAFYHPFAAARAALNGRHARDA